MTGGRSGATDTARILEDRARELARPLEREDRVETVGILVVVVGSERYALGLGRVMATEFAIELTPVPGVPGFWSGLANVHGTLYPVLDLGRYLGIDSIDPLADKMLVLVNGAGMDVALLVDDVLDVTWISRDSIGPPPSTGGGQRVIEGVTADLFAMLDVEALLSDPDLVVDDEAAQ